MKMQNQFFLKKNIQKLYTLKKKKRFTRTVQVNCTVHANTNLKKQLEAASPILRSKRELTWPHRSLNSVFDITKHHVWCGCSKRRSNHTNKRSLSNQVHFGNRLSLPTKCLLVKEDTFVQLVGTLLQSLFGIVVAFVVVV